MNRFFQWLRRRGVEDDQLAIAVRDTFSSVQGRKTLGYLLNTYYYSITATNEYGDLAAHSGARAVIQDLLNKFDAAEMPQKPTEVIL